MNRIKDFALQATLPANDDYAVIDGATNSTRKILAAAFLFGANNLSDIASAATARSNLGLGSIATQSASAVNITGGTVSGLSSLSVNGNVVLNGGYNEIQMPAIGDGLTFKNGSTVVGGIVRLNSRINFNASTGASAGFTFNTSSVSNAFQISDSGNITVLGTGTSSFSGSVSVASQVLITSSYKNWTCYNSSGDGRLHFLVNGGSDSLNLADSLVAIPLTTASTATNNGALVVTGGVGIGGALNVGGNLTVNGATTSLLGGLSVTNGGTFGGVLQFAGDTRYGVAKIWQQSVGDMFGLEQVSAAQSGDVPATRIFTSSINQAAIDFGKYTSATAFTNWMRLGNNGNILIGATVDAGYKLDVNGSARVQGAATVSSGSLTVSKTSNDALLTVSTTTAGAFLQLDSFSDGYEGVRLRSNGVDKWAIGAHNGNTNFVIARSDGSTNRYFEIATTGGATFSSSATVNGTLTVTANAAGGLASFITQSSATGYGIKIRGGNDANYSVGIVNAANTVMVYSIDGFGNSTQAGSFTASGNITASSGVLNVQSSSGSEAYLRLNQVGTTAWDIRNIATSGNLYFSNSGNDWFTLSKATGAALFNGALTAATTLTVSGSSQFGGQIAVDRVSSGTAAYVQASSVGAGGQVNILFGKANSTNNEATLIYHHVGDGSASNYLGVGFYGSDDLLNLKANGNLGLGTTSPATRLHVNNGASDSSLSPIYQFSNATAVFSTGDGGANDTYVRVIGGKYTQANTTSLDLIHLGKDYGQDQGWRVKSGCGTTQVNNSYLAFNRLTTNGTSILETEYARLNSQGYFLFGTTTDSSNGRLQLASHTTAAGGVGFGSDTVLYRSAAGQLTTDGKFQVGGAFSCASGGGTFIGNGAILALQYSADGGEGSLAWKNSSGTTLWRIGGNLQIRQDELVFQRGGTAVMYLNNSNNVAVGGTTASQQLHVNVDVYGANKSGGFRIGNGGNNYYTDLLITTDGSSNPSLVQSFATHTLSKYAYGGGNNYWAWYTNNAERMRLDSNGNLGIGTGSPSYLLHVGGTPGATNGALAFLRDGVASGTNNSLGTITFSSSPGTDYYIGKKSELTVGSLVFGNANSGAEYARLTSGGNFLFGTTTDAGAKLSIIGNIAAYVSGGSQLYLGSTEFNNSSYYNSAPGIGAVNTPVYGVAGSLAFYTYGGASNARTEVGRFVGSSNNLLIGTTTDAGQKLQVAGRMAATDGSGQGIVIARQLGSTYTSSAAAMEAQTDNPNTGANNQAFGSYRSGDTYYRYVMSMDGRMNWGSGSATQDLALSRITAGYLAMQTSGSLDPAFVIRNATGGSATPQLIFDRQGIQAAVIKLNAGNGILEFSGAKGVFLDTTDTTAVSTGALQSAGGIYAARNIWANGSMICSAGNGPINGIHAGQIYTDASNAVNIYAYDAGGIILRASGGGSSPAADLTVANGGNVTSRGSLNAGTSISIGSGLAPASASSAGSAGTVVWDSGYVYVCTALNTWKRAALSTW